MISTHRYIPKTSALRVFSSSGLTKGINTQQSLAFLSQKSMKCNKAKSFTRLFSLQSPSQYTLPPIQEEQSYEAAVVENDWDKNQWEDARRRCDKFAFLLNGYTGHGIFPVTHKSRFITFIRDQLLFYRYLPLLANRFASHQECACKNVRGGLVSGGTHARSCTRSA